MCDTKNAPPQRLTNKSEICRLLNRDTCARDPADLRAARCRIYTETIGINVEHTNMAAIRVYEHLGFRTHFTYYEGVADRLPLTSR